MDDQILIAGHLTTTMAMVGIMWTVQLVVYPQFASAPRSTSTENGFTIYLEAHSKRIISVLAVFAPAEILFTLLVWIQRPFGVSGPLSFTSGVLLAIGWISTAFWFAPLHGRLQRKGFDRPLINQLITSNWARTTLWSARGALAFWITVTALR